MAKKSTKKTSAKRATPPAAKLPSTKRSRGLRGQSEIPGSRNVDKAVEAKALDYADKRDERMSLTKEEKSAKSELLDLMDAKKLKSYPMADGRTVLVEETTTRTVRVVTPKTVELDDEIGDGIDF